MAATGLSDMMSASNELEPLMFDPEDEQRSRKPGTVAPLEVGTPAGTAALPGKSFGENNEKLPKKLQIALQMLLTLYVNEGQVARRDEVKKCHEARQFWKGLQYAYFSEGGQWHLPWETNQGDVSGEDQDEPRYAYVTNYYQAFGLSIMAVLSQDIPAVRLWPQSPENTEDVVTAEAGTTVIELIERNNRMTDLLVDEAFYLWCDGKLGAYVRYVTDGSRFGYHDDEQMEPSWAKMGEDSYQCPADGVETPQAGFMGVCQHCGQPLGQEHFNPAPTAMVPKTQQVSKSPNGAEVIDVMGGLELKTPPWARAQHQFPYLIWDQLAHRSKLKASFPWVGKQIGGSAITPEDSQAQYERTSMITLISGGDMEPIGASGDLTQNLVTFRQAWMRPWAYELLDDEQVVDQLYECFPTGCYVAFAGDVYCCSRNESMDDHWRVMHALPGDGQNRPAIGSSFISVQQRYNTLANLVVETAEHAIPATWASPAVVDFDALRESYAEPGSIYQSPAAAGTSVRDGFYETQPAQVSQYVLEHMNMLAGQTGEFLTGAFPALFGGEMQGNDTAAGYSMARDQAMGRIGLVWRRMKTFHADLMLLAVDVFRKNRPDDVEAPIFGPGGQAKARWIHKADLKGNVVAYPESDTQYPTLWSQQRSTLMQLMQSPDPMIQKVLGDPENLALLKRLIGLEDFQIPDEDSRQKQLEEIDHMLSDAEQGRGPFPGAPQMAPHPETGQMQPQLHPQTGQPMMGPPQSSLPIDPLLDNHEVEADTIRTWANSEQGRQAKQQNPLGFLNVRAHYLRHFEQLQQNQAGGGKPPSESINFKDLPPDGQAQMAKQAGIKLNPAELAMKQMQDAAQAAAKAKARPAPGGNA